MLDAAESGFEHATGVAPDVLGGDDEDLARFGGNVPRDVADAYLEFLRTDHPEKALMLRTLPEMRELDETWAYFQYNADTHQFSSNIRFNIQHHPLSDLYLVYNDTRDTDKAPEFPIGIADRCLSA